MGSRLDRQREALDKAQKDMEKAERISQGVSVRRNYIDEISRNLENASDTTTERVVFDKNPPPKGLVDKIKNWFD